MDLLPIVPGLGREAALPCEGLGRVGGALLGEGLGRTSALPGEGLSRVGGALPGEGLGRVGGALPSEGLASTVCRFSKAGCWASGHPYVQPWVSLSNHL